MAKCANCGADVEYGKTYCTLCVEYLVASDKFSFADKWKYYHSADGCIGCRYISGGTRACEGCIRDHAPIPPFIDMYEKG